MKTYIKSDEYLALPKEVRDRLIQTFAINKSGGMSIRDNKLVSDGTSQQDLINGLTIGKLIDFLGTRGWKKVDNEKLFDDLFTKCLEKINEQIKNTGGASQSGENEGAKAESKGDAKPAVKV